MKTRWFGLLGLLFGTAGLIGLNGCSGATSARPEADDVSAEKPAKVVRAQEPEEDKPKAGQLDPALGLRGLTLPNDKGGRLMVKTLTHPDQSPRVPKLWPHGQPLPFPKSLGLRDSPALPSVAEVADLPQSTPVATLRPRSTLDEPFPDEESGLTLPERPRLVAGAAFRLPAPDPTEPPLLPILAAPQTDRAAFDDVTAAASLLAALSARPVMRQLPAPLLRQTLPDPFANRRVVELRIAQVEDPEPRVSTPKPPPR